MNDIFKGLIAGYGAKKLGGGCFSTILIFIIIWYALGHCGNGTTTTTTRTNATGSVVRPHNNNSTAVRTAHGFINS